MTLPEPFAYPAAPHARRHGPAGYRDPADYKPWLRDEFTFRCVYCLEREAWAADRADSFSVDHFAARSTDPALAGDYDNLVYACTRCNSNKQAGPVPLDPARVAFADHLAVTADGRLVGQTTDEADLVDVLRLNESPALDNRREALLLLRLEREQPDNPVVHALFVAAFGYPADLPDLGRLRPPGGNARPEGVAGSHYARREKGELPEVY